MHVTAVSECAFAALLDDSILPCDVETGGIFLTIKKVEVRVEAQTATDHILDMVKARQRSIGEETIVKYGGNLVLITNTGWQGDKNH